MRFWWYGFGLSTIFRYLCEKESDREKAPLWGRGNEWNKSVRIDYLDNNSLRVCVQTYKWLKAAKSL